MAHLGDSYVAFEKVVTAEMSSLYGTALRLTRNPSDAEDLVADTVANAWAAKDSLKDQNKVRPWLFRIMTNGYISDYRRRSSSPEIGAQIGHVGMVREILARVRDELATRDPDSPPPRIIATGGHAELIAAGLPEIEAIEPHLTLDGLRLIGNLNTAASSTHE